MASVIAACSPVLVQAQAQNEQPGTAYIYPAGGQRGTEVRVTIGGYNLTPTTQLHFEGGGLPLVSLPRPTGKTVPPVPAIRGETANRPFNYSRELETKLKIDVEAVPGLRPWRVSTAQGGTASRLFVIGDLPELLEQPAGAGDAAPQRLALPVTANGRIEKSEEIDGYVFAAKAGERIRCEVLAGRIGSALDARLEVLDSSGRLVMSDEDSRDIDPLVQFTAAEAGDYRVRIHDFRFSGSAAHVYRLTVRSIAVDEREPASSANRAVVGNYEAVTEVAEVEPNDALAPAATVSNEPSSPAVSPEPFRPADAPRLIHGHLEPGDQDCYRFSAKKGERIFAGVWGARLGSNLDTVLTVVGPEGKEIARNDDDAGSSDSELEFAIPADGDYTVTLTDLSGSHAAGREASYQLIIGAARPDFALSFVTDFADVAPGGTVSLLIKVDRSGGFEGPIDLELAGFDVPGGTRGVRAENLKIPAKSKDHKLVLKGVAGALYSSFPLRIKGTAQIGERACDRLVRFPRAGGNPLVQAESVLVTVTQPCPFKITADDTYFFSSRGTTHPARFKIERAPGFEGEVLLSLADKQVRYLQGISGPQLRVPAGVTDVVYPLFLPETVELNRTCRVLVAATAEVQTADGGTQHVLAVSPKQCVMRVEPAILALASTPEFLEMNCGNTVPLTITVRRALTYNGPVRVELVLPEGARGITAESLHVPAGQTTAEVQLQIARDADLAGHDGVRFRATGMHGELPVVAEVLVEMSIRKPER